MDVAQIHDGVFYQGEYYNVAGVSGGKLVHARDLGVTQLIGDYNCWRGYHCQYVIEEKQLILVEMEVSSRETLLIQGIAPVLDGASHNFSAVYRGLHLSVDFAGGILGGKDLVWPMYLDTNFQQPPGFGRLLEFQFEQGKLMAVNDHSARMAAIRQRIEDERKAWEAAHHDELAEIARLRRVIETMGAIRDVLPDTGLTTSEVAAKQSEIHGEMALMQKRIMEIRIPSPRWNELIKQWMAEAFSPDYRL